MFACKPHVLTKSKSCCAGEHLVIKQSRSLFSRSQDKGIRQPERAIACQAIRETTGKASADGLRFAVVRSSRILTEQKLSHVTLCWLQNMPPILDSAHRYLEDKFAVCNPYDCTLKHASTTNHRSSQPFQNQHLSQLLLPPTFG